jgi:acyl-coenzyme A thioesterase PaaI-like protein
MLQNAVSDGADRRINARPQSSCFACGPDNSRGLHLRFRMNEDGNMAAQWTPKPELEGFQGIIHGGIISTVLDEAMSKAVAVTGTQALTADLRVRFRQRVSSGNTVRIRGWIESRHKRMIKTEAALTASDGTELAHAWGIFLALEQR